MKQKTVLTATPILLVLVTLSIFATPVAATPENEQIYALGKAVMWCKGQCYSGEADIVVEDNEISLLALFDTLTGVFWDVRCNFEMFKLTIITGSNPTGQLRALTFVIVFVCGDSVTCYAFGWGCFLYFKGTVTLDANNH